MAVTIKKIVLWRKEVENRAGMLANALAPLAHAGTNIHVVMAYRFPGQDARAAIELYPVTGRKSTNAAKEVGFNAFESHRAQAFLVVGNQPGPFVFVLSKHRR